MFFVDVSICFICSMCSYDVLFLENPPPPKENMIYLLPLPKRTSNHYPGSRYRECVQCDKSSRDLCKVSWGVDALVSAICHDCGCSLQPALDLGGIPVRRESVDPLIWLKLVALAARLADPRPAVDGLGHVHHLSASLIPLVNRKPHCPLANSMVLPPLRRSSTRCAPVSVTWLLRICSITGRW